MSDPFVAEIRIFPFNFPPKGWAFCDGQILPISQNTALFSLLGTTYGGDGRSNFALPNLQGCLPLHVGSGPGPGLSVYDLGETTGTETVTLLPSEMPVHSHPLNAQTVDQGDNRIPGPALNLANEQIYTSATSPQVAMGSGTIGPSGGNLPHNNLMPYLTLNFCVALQGIFPPRT